ncbi:MAG: 1-deoxy-D-xylulose-5-phosphate reductoisomerase [bacterium]
MKNIVVLGSTGSIGVNCLKVVEEFPDRFKVVGLTAGRNIGLLAEQACRFRPKAVAVAERDAVGDLRKLISDPAIEVTGGSQGIARVAALAEADQVVSAISGGAGLVPTAAAIDAGKDIALANKETLVMAGEIITRLAKTTGSAILPVDSEHSAIFQCLRGADSPGEVKRLVLTASGGPFLNRTDLEKVTVAEALAHPNWKMGPKVSLDSATMMNKGLELIEARWLFGEAAEKLSVLIHPQSIVHSLVEFVDGAYLAHLGIADMRIPILYALSFPERVPFNLPSLNLAQVGNLTFIEPDPDKFPSLRLVSQAMESGGYAPVILNAANEVAANLFLREKIGFCDIIRVVEQALESISFTGKPEHLDQVLGADRETRHKTLELANKHKK